MSKTSEVGKIVIINVIICLVIILLAEAGLRVFYKNRFLTEGNQYLFFEFDDELGWVGKKNSAGQFKRGEEFDTYITTNSHGMRDKEYSYEKPENTFRVAVLGDSFTWGFGVENEDNYTEVMEKDLGKEYEILNFGVSGYGRGQQLLYFKREVMQFNPDAVIIMAYPGNDLYDNVADDPAMEIYPRPAFSVDENGKLKISGIPLTKPGGSFEERSFMRHIGKWMGLYSRSYSFRVFYHAFNTVLKSWEKDPSKYVNPIYQVSNLPVLEKQAKVEHAIMKEFKQLLDEKGIQLLVAIASTTEMVRPQLQRLQEKNAKGVDIDWKQPARILSQASQSLGISVVKLAPVLLKSEQQGKKVHNNREFHWSKYGNYLVAKELEPYVKEMQIKFANKNQPEIESGDASE